MIRQHFYPKSYFRHRSLSKNQCKTDIHVNSNCQSIFSKQIQLNQIKFITKKQSLKQRNSSSYHFQPLDTQLHQKLQTILKPSNIKAESFVQQQNYTEESESNVLRQIHNKSNKQNSQKKHKHYENDISSLFIKSDRKQIIKANRSSYRGLGIHNEENQSFCIQSSWNNQSRKSARKLSSADASRRCYKKSIQRKKKQDKTPVEIIIHSTLSTLETKQLPHSERRKDPTFQKITDNLINLNLSKAIKYRQTGMQQKIYRQRKTLQKINVQNIADRAFDFEQKVRGWEIQVEDDVDFS